MRIVLFLISFSLTIQVIAGRIFYLFCNSKGVCTGHIGGCSQISTDILASDADSSSYFSKMHVFIVLTILVQEIKPAYSGLLTDISVLIWGTSDFKRTSGSVFVTVKDLSGTVLAVSDPAGYYDYTYSPTTVTFGTPASVTAGISYKLEFIASASLTRMAVTDKANCENYAVDGYPLERSFIYQYTVEEICAGTSGDPHFFGFKGQKVYSKIYKNNILSTT